MLVFRHVLPGKLFYVTYTCQRNGCHNFIIMVCKRETEYINLTLLQSFLLHWRSRNCRKEGRHFHTLCSHVVNPKFKLYWSNWRQNTLCTVDPQYDEPLNYEILDIMNDNILSPSYSKTYGKEPWYNKTHFRNHISPVPWPFGE